MRFRKTLEIQFGVLTEFFDRNIAYTLAVTCSPSFLIFAGDTASAAVAAVASVLWNGILSVFSAA